LRELDVHKPVLATPLLIVLLALSGCASGGGDSAGAEAPANRFLSIGTAPPGGAFFVVGGALGEVLNEHGEAGWQVTAEATKGSQENIRRLTAGELDLALANSAITYFAVRGSEGWDRAHEMRTVMTLAPNVAQFLAPADGAIAAIADLKGKRVAALPSGAGVPYFLNPILAEHGLGWDDIEWVPGSQAASADKLGDGSVDAAFLGGAIPTGAITQAAASRSLRFLPYDAAAREKLTGEYPFYGQATIPAGTYPGIDEDYSGLDVGSMHLIAHASADDDLVYALTKTIYENREAVTERHKAGRAINERNCVRDTGTPFHPGAIRYYEEIGIWQGAGP
jgi:TRAP transporter TAXI family solute receptor